MIGKLRAFRRRFPNFWLATMIGGPVGLSLWLASIFFPYYVSLQASTGVNQLDIRMENGGIAVCDMGWHGSGNPPTNWWSFDNHLVVAHPVKLSKTGPLDEEGWVHFLGLSLPLFDRDPKIPNNWWISTWPLIPAITFVVWVILSFLRKVQRD